MQILIKYAVVKVQNARVSLIQVIKQVIIKYEG